ncbi:hypothetical protein PIB30_044386 [Stylosanthes scabra]|uniref:Uncharacterized protein n=1 Tax=Stylosanthes scabra TaxID=79078 RepID=A0ABU6WGW5_9FABA|nr:hypothetical protein [Stylosanthes scabra]
MAAHRTISTPLPTMAPGLTTDSGAIQNGKPQPPLPIRRAKGSQAQLIGISNVPLFRDVHDLNRVLRLGGDDNIVVRMICTLLQRRTIKIWLVKWHFVKPDMEYDGSTDPHEHLRDFEHRMVCDKAIDKVKCRAFPVTLTRLASKWFTLSTRSISTFVEVRELSLTGSTTGIDNTKYSINFLAVIQ